MGEYRIPPGGWCLGLLLIMVAASILPTDACSGGSCQLLDSCSVTGDCGPGLYCGNCPSMGKDQTICMRGQDTQVTSIVDGLPFNKYTWLVTHNAFSIASEPSFTGTSRVTFYNQEDSVTNQLMNGVRGLMLDLYDFGGDIWLCHSFGGQCYNFTAFKPAILTLKEVEAFLATHPSEIITIFIEDYVHAPNGLTKLFTDAGLMKYWFPLSKMPADGKDWPTVTEMVNNNHRLLVFTDNQSKENDEGIAYEWRYLLENESGDEGMKPGSCPNRRQSQALDSKSSSLLLQNYFPSFPEESDSCKEHSTSLAEMVGTCYKAAGNKMPNFLAVNFYMRSDGGGVFDIIDWMNGHTICGCSSVIACQAGAPPGSCKSTNTPVSKPPSENGRTTYSGTIQFTGLSSSANRRGYYHIGKLFCLIFLLI
ncbi:unnamed protein product [Victoria cruziana]